MATTNKIAIDIEEVTSMTCDSCKKIFENPIEIQEFQCILKTAGYGSIFGDGAAVHCDLCQYCLRDMLGPFLKVVRHSHRA
ncbi:hypothetical protein [Zhongshania arctica]|uniref:Uncharacterized protein n=1 Tax=Zhongshania arctica TaxID=3238302 RepID=A0ABV3TYS0_9GAMM|tara:strand:+ start:2390 stop:2632 length:243 start_codon:yes stop_codon:yes gene_type:complete